MTRRWFFFVTLLLVAVLSMAQTKKKLEVKLDSDNSEFSQSINGYILYAKLLGDGDSEEEAEVSIELEHGGGDNNYSFMMVFPSRFTEKELKKQKVTTTSTSDPMKINYSKLYPWSRDFTEKLEGITSIRIIGPTDGQESLVTVKVKGKNSIRLPFYFAEKKQNKLMIFDFLDITLDIEAQLKPDEQYNSLQKEYAQLDSLLKNQWCCTNAKHKETKDVEGKIWVPTSERNKLKIRRDRAVEEIQKINSESKLGDTKLEKFKKYDNLMKLFNSLDFETNKGVCLIHKTGPDDYLTCKWCGAQYRRGSTCPNNRKTLTHIVCGKKAKHGSLCPHDPVCTCCGQTEKSIYNRMETLAKQVDAAQDRRKEANKVKSEAINLKNCSTQKCSLHPKGQFTSRINTAYNRIAKYF